jgi:mRNA-degrading endonuclease toxin of MazEF toxin-antitoxin module
MTATNTPTVPANGKRPATAIEKYMGANVAGLAVSALVSWAGGDAAWHGWHVSMPFLPTWLLLMSAVLTVSVLAYIVATHWHTVKADTAAEIATKTKAAEHLVAVWLQGEVGKALAAKIGGAS